MSFVTRGFHGRRRDDDGRLPPGQHLTGDFPVLSAGPTPRIPLDEWELWVATEDGTRHTWSWTDLMALAVRASRRSTSTASRAGPSSTPTWRGVSLDTLLADVETAADFAMVHSYGGYTTNLPLEDLLDGKAWIAYEFDGDDLHPEHGGPARLLVPHLYFWKSAKWVRGIELMLEDDPGLLGAARLPRLRRPMARAAIPGGLSARRAWRPAAARRAPGRDRQRDDARARRDDWPGHLPGQHVDVRLTADDGYTATRSYSSRRRRPTATASSSPCNACPTARCRPSSATTCRSATRSSCGGRSAAGSSGGPEQPGPVLLVAGGSGVVPLMAMLRARPADGPPFRLVYSAREPDDVIYRDELGRLATSADGAVDVSYVFTRRAPEGEARSAGRLRGDDLDRARLGPVGCAHLLRLRPDGLRRGRGHLLGAAGHDPARIRTERFGPSGP